jgi:hypothetical protein
MCGIESPLVGSQDAKGWANRPDANPTTNRRRPLECPNCGADLKIEIHKSADRCLFCREALEFPVWHRLLVAFVGVFLDVLIVAVLRLQGFILIGSLLLLLFPAIVLAYGLMLIFVPPNLKRHNPTVTTLFRRERGALTPGKSENRTSEPQRFLLDHPPSF